VLIVAPFLTKTYLRVLGSPLAALFMYRQSKNLQQLPQIEHLVDAMACFAFATHFMSASCCSNTSLTLQAIKDWYKIKLELPKKQPY
jgi:hypothetical protein